MRFNAETIVSMPTSLTENEVNNLIYSLIKFGFRRIKEPLNSPPNRVIKNIMLCTMENPTIEHIIDVTFETIVREYGICLKEEQNMGLRTHMKLIADLFMSEPLELRGDLGEDKDSNEFITKH